MRGRDLAAGCIVWWRVFQGGARGIGAASLSLLVRVRDWFTASGYFLTDLRGVFVFVWGMIV